MEPQKTQICQSSLEKKKNKAKGTTLPNLRQYYRITVIKTDTYWHKNGRIDQWHRIESPEINPHTCGQLVYGKRGKTSQWRKDSFFNK